MRALFFLIIVSGGICAEAQTWQWARQIGGPGNETVYLAGCDQSSAAYAYGWFANSQISQQFDDCYIEDDTLHGRWGSFLAKYNADGSLAWARAITSPAGGVNAFAAMVDTVGERILVVGSYKQYLVLDTAILTTGYGAAFLSIWNYDGHCIQAINVATNPYNLMQDGCSARGVTMDEDGRVVVGLVTVPGVPSSVYGQPFAGGAFVVVLDEQLQLDRLVAMTEHTAWSHTATPVGLIARDGSLTIQSGIYLGSPSDTLVVMGEVLTGVSGSGIGLTRIHLGSGDLEWQRFDGFPFAGGGNVQRFCPAPDTTMVLIGNYQNGSVFGQDTLACANTMSCGFIARYDAEGILLMLHPISATTFLNLRSCVVLANGNILLAGGLNGIGDWGNGPFDTGGLVSFVSQHDPYGECVGMVQFGPATGNGVAVSSDGVYVAARFGSSSPTPATLTVGNQTFTSHGWADGIVAKLDLVVGIQTFKNNDDDRLLIYANPNQGSFRLVLPEALSHASKLTLRVYDATGRHLHEQTLDRNEERPRVDVWNVSPGFYMVTVSDGHRTYSGNMVVE